MPSVSYIVSIHSSDRTVLKNVAVKVKNPQEISQKQVAQIVCHLFEQSQKSGQTASSSASFHTLHPLTSALILSVNGAKKGIVTYRIGNQTKDISPLSLSPSSSSLQVKCRDLKIPVKPTPPRATYLEHLKNTLTTWILLVPFINLLWLCIAPILALINYIKEPGKILQDQVNKDFNAWMIDKKCPSSRQRLDDDIKFISAFYRLFNRLNTWLLKIDQLSFVEKEKWLPHMQREIIRFRHAVDRFFGAEGSYKECLAIHHGLFRKLDRLSKDLEERIVKWQISNFARQAKLCQKEFLKSAVKEPDSKVLSDTMITCPDKDNRYSRWFPCVATDLVVKRAPTSSSPTQINVRDLCFVPTTLKKGWRLFTGNYDDGWQWMQGRVVPGQPYITDTLQELSLSLGSLFNQCMLPLWNLTAGVRLLVFPHLFENSKLHPTHHDSLLEINIAKDGRIVTSATGFLYCAYLYGAKKEFTKACHYLELAANECFIDAEKDHFEAIEQNLSQLTGSESRHELAFRLKALLTIDKIRREQIPLPTMRLKERASNIETCMNRLNMLRTRAQAGPTFLYEESFHKIPEEEYFLTDAFKEKHGKEKKEEKEEKEKNSRVRATATYHILQPTCLRVYKDEEHPDETENLSEKINSRLCFVATEIQAFRKQLLDWAKGGNAPNSLRKKATSGVYSEGLIIQEMIQLFHKGLLKKDYEEEEDVVICKIVFNFLLASIDELCCVHAKRKLDNEKAGDSKELFEAASHKDSFWQDLFVKNPHLARTLLVVEYMAQTIFIHPEIEFISKICEDIIECVDIEKLIPIDEARKSLIVAALVSYRGKQESGKPIPVLCAPNKRQRNQLRKLTYACCAERGVFLHFDFSKKYTAKDLKEFLKRLENGCFIICSREQRIEFLQSLKKRMAQKDNPSDPEEASLYFELKKIELLISNH